MSVLSLRRALGRGTAWALVRQVAAVAFVAAAAVTFSLFSPSYRYVQAEGYRAAPFDLWVNGPFTEENIDRLDGILDASVLLVADITPRYLHAGDRKALVSNGRFFSNPELADMIYPQALNVDGASASALHGNEIILDSQTAETLGVAVGDEVQGNIQYPNGQVGDLTFRLATVVIPTAHLRSSLGGVLTPAVRAVVSADAPLISSAYISEADLANADTVVGSLGPDYQTFRRSDLLNAAVAQANALVDPIRELVFIALSGGVLLVFLIRDLRSMLQLRSRAAAVLIALGTRPSTIAATVIVEQLFLIAVGLVLGSLGGVAWFASGFHMPVPLAELGLVFGALGALAIAAVIAVTAVVTRRLSTIPINRLLFEGS